jgi:hypothetical protein
MVSSTHAVTERERHPHSSTFPLWPHFSSDSERLDIQLRLDRGFLLGRFY